MAILVDDEKVKRVLTIDDPAVVKLADELAEKSGQSVEEVIRAALEAQARMLEALPRAQAPVDWAKVEAIIKEAHMLLPDKLRPEEEVLEWDDMGLPK